MTTYDFVEGQIVQLFHGVPEAAWTIYEVSDAKLRAVLKWNDRDGDFDELDRKTLLEIFLHDFIVTCAK